MSKSKQKYNTTKHAFLHAFFPSSIGYQEIEVNGFHLINQFNKGTDRWEVAIYTPEAYQAHKNYSSSQTLL